MESGCEGPGLALAMAGGGTGGHVVPGLHLLSSFARRPGSLGDVLWFVAGRPVEERVLAGVEALVRPAAIERVPLALEPAEGGAPSKARLLLHTPRATLRARRALARHASRVLLGLGGYTSLPPVLAARSRGVPVALLEINAAPGLATRSLERFAARVFHAWPDTVPPSGEGKHVLVGPPLAPTFVADEVTAEGSSAARAALGFDPDRPLLVVLGGSQGAASLNRFVRAYAARLTGAGIQLLHQAGPDRLSEGARERPGYRCAEYVRPMEEALAAATVVLCRGGASTVAEVGAMRRPAVVVPYPHSPDRHQERNARQLREGAIVVSDDALDAGLCELLIELCGPQGGERRRRMSAELARAIPTDAADRIREALLELAGAR